jgi:hypothetical protein
MDSPGKDCERAGAQNRPGWSVPHARRIQADMAAHTPTANANSFFFFRSAIFQIYVIKAKLVVDVVNLQHGIKNSKSGCKKQ